MQFIVRSKSILKVKINIIVLVAIIFFGQPNTYASIINKSYLEITSPAAVVIDYSSGRVLYDKNSTDKRSIASLTKIMTSIMLVEYCNMDEIIEIPAAATWIGGSEVGLKKGDKVTAKALLYGMLLPSR